MNKKTPFTVACVQINSSNNMASNLNRANELVSQAAEQGAQLILLPENVALMAGHSRELHMQAVEMERHKAIVALSKLAKTHNIWLVVGSIAVPAAHSGKMYNRCVVISPDGMIVNHYDKIHLYDVVLPDGDTYSEPKNFDPGKKLVMQDLPWGTLGLSICYDLRFPHMFRALAKRGSDFLSIPAAFVQLTGAAHWHVLLRARAIETGCYVFAPAQVGSHPGDRKTYGHSLIIDPWGEVIADAGGIEEGIIMANIDPVKVGYNRKVMPSLSHDRPFE